MKSTQRIADHLRSLHFGPNWTGVNLRDKLADVTFQEATTSVASYHTIATLVFHMNYYVGATTKVLRGGELEAKDELSFHCPPLRSEHDWNERLDQTWTEAEELASLIERLPDERLGETFEQENYGTYYRCLQGPIEHGYYHLGQIAIVKLLLRNAR